MTWGLIWGVLAGDMRGNDFEGGGLLAVLAVRAVRAVRAVLGVMSWRVAGYWLGVRVGPGGVQDSGRFEA